MRPHGRRPDLPVLVETSEPAKLTKRRPKSTLAVRSGDTDILDLTVREALSASACTPAAPQTARFSPKAIHQDVINE